MYLVLAVVDVSVPAKGFKAKDGQTFKVLASYDGLCNCTKIYINDKLRGIADPFDIGRAGYHIDPSCHLLKSIPTLIALNAIL
jgi:hypothetical protein